MDCRINELETIAARTRWWTPGEAGELTCRLCPHECRIRPGRTGLCGIRRNHEGRLLGLGYGHPSGFAADPIEKKPLYHFLPGSRILSFGTVGCHLRCRFCQNWSLSRSQDVETARDLVRPEEVVRLAQEAGCPSIAFTYNEPTIFAEYALEVALAAHEAGLRTVAVTAGYINPEPRAELFQALDGANVDLKGFSDEFYTRWTGAHLAPVLDTLRWIHQETSCWLEVTNLVIPGLNDDEDAVSRLVDWVHEALGEEVPLHFSAFHPAGQVTDRPRTPAARLDAARQLARRRGRRFVYIGNVDDPEEAATRCPGCGEVLVTRHWGGVDLLRLVDGGCPRCRLPLPGVWAASGPTPGD